MVFASRSVSSSRFRKRASGRPCSKSPIASKPRRRRGRPAARAGAADRARDGTAAPSRGRGAWSARWMEERRLQAARLPRVRAPGPTHAWSKFASTSASSTTSRRASRRARRSEAREPSSWNASWRTSQRLEQRRQRPPTARVVRSRAASIDALKARHPPPREYRSDRHVGYTRGDGFRASRQPAGGIPASRPDRPWCRPRRRWNRGEQAQHRETRLAQPGIAGLEAPRARSPATGRRRCRMAACSSMCVQW